MSECKSVLKISMLMPLVIIRSLRLVTVNCISLYCITVGSRRIMPLDALQPKAYCINPGLYSFLLAPPSVSTRDPSSERRNYLGRWILPENARLPRNIQGSFTCSKSTTRDKRLYFPSEGRRAEDFFFALKNPTASAGFEPTNLGTKGQHATSRPPKPFFQHNNMP